MFQINFCQNIQFINQKMEAEYILQQVHIQKYQPIRIIYKDMYYSQKLCRNKLTNEWVLIRRIKKRIAKSKNLIPNIQLEIKLLRLLQIQESHHFLKIRQLYQNQYFFYIVFDFEPDTYQLDHFLKKSTLQPKDIQGILANIIIILEKIHSLGYYHNNLKPDDFRIRGDGSFILMNIFFAKKIEKCRRDKFDITVQQEFHPFLAPQLFEYYTEQGFFVDFWALGVILYYMIFNQIPKILQERDNIKKKTGNFIQEFLENKIISKEAADMIKKLIRRSNDRLGRNGGISQIKNHNYFSKFDWENLQLKIQFNQIKQIGEQQMQQQIWYQLYNYEINPSITQDSLNYSMFKDMPYLNQKKIENNKTITSENITKKEKKEKKEKQTFNLSKKIHKFQKQNIYLKLIHN